MKKFKVDLHLHTNTSYDAVVSFENLKKAYRAGKFDAVAITDHGAISAAVEFVKKNEFPVIVGQEIETTAGDVIGLFLKKEIVEHQGVLETLFAIHSQGGLVYIPHPFDALKSGLEKEVILSILPNIDLFETHNYSYRAGVLRRNPKELVDFAQKHHLVAAAGSDAHIPSGIGKAFLEFENADEKILADGQTFLQACKSATPKMISEPRYKIVLKHFVNFPYMKKSFWPMVCCLTRAFKKNLRNF